MRALLPGQSLEPLTLEELKFLQRQERRDRTQFYKVLRVILVLCFVCSFVISWLRALAGAPDPFALGPYLLGVLFLMCFAGLCCYIGYRAFLYKVQRDIRGHSKMIERARITEKRYMPQNNTWHFYLDSPQHLSIEVSEQDYGLLNIGDELNIEYTPYSNTYLGYF